MSEADAAGVSRKRCLQAVIDKLRWTPSNENEWVSLNSQASWYRQFPQMGDDEARALLERILELRSSRLKSREPNQAETDEVQKLAVKLIEGSAGWAFSDALAVMGFGGILQSHPAFQSQIAAQWLAVPLPFIPPSVRNSLRRALEALMDGRTEPILQKAVGGRRGAEPSRRAEIESLLLAWIEWRGARDGRGGKSRATNEVMHACGLRSSQALDRWRKNNEEPELLEQAREIGRIQSQGSKLPPHLCSFAEILKALSLDRLAALLSEACRPRSR
jgi:hypothetical protein